MTFEGPSKEVLSGEIEAETVFTPRIKLPKLCSDMFAGAMLGQCSLARVQSARVFVGIY